MRRESKCCERVLVNEKGNKVFSFPNNHEISSSEMEAVSYIHVTLNVHYFYDVKW